MTVNLPFNYGASSFRELIIPWQVEPFRAQIEGMELQQLKQL